MSEEAKKIRILEEENTNLKLKLEYEKERRISCEKLFRNYRLKLIREQNRVTKKCLIEKNERLNNIIKEVREYITSQKLHKIQDTTGALTYQEIKLLEILDKGE